MQCLEFLIMADLSNKYEYDKYEVAPSILKRYLISQNTILVKK